MNEEWKIVTGQPYEVSDLGRVRRTEPSKGAIVGTILNPRIRGRYLSVNLWNGGLSKAKYVHRLVAEAFLGPCPSGHEANHKNGDRFDPSLGNLEYVTPSENKQHSYRIGIRRRRYGDSWHRSKVSELDVTLILLWCARGFTRTAVAKAFGLSRTHVGDIVAGRKRPMHPRPALEAEGGEG